MFTKNISYVNTVKIFVNRIKKWLLPKKKFVITMKACHSEQKFNEVEFAKNPFRL